MQRYCLKKDTARGCKTPKPGRVAQPRYSSYNKARMRHQFCDARSAAWTQMPAQDSREMNEAETAKKGRTPKVPPIPFIQAPATGKGRQGQGFPRCWIHPWIRNCTAVFYINNFCFHRIGRYRAGKRHEHKKREAHIGKKRGTGAATTALKSVGPCLPHKFFIFYNDQIAWGIFLCALDLLLYP